MSVLEGSKRVFPWKMFLCTEEYAFVTLYEDTRKQPPELDETAKVTKCSLSKSLDSTLTVMIEFEFNVVECCSLNGQYVQYYIEKQEGSPNQPFQQSTVTV